MGSTEAVDQAPSTTDLPADSRGGSSLAAALSSDGGGFEALATPDTSDLATNTRGGGGVIANPQQNATPPAPAQEPLKGLGGRFKGVLYGLATGGAIGGVEGAIAPNVTRTHFQQGEQMRASKLAEQQARTQFESVQAADTYIKASHEAERLDLLNEESRIEVAQKQAEYRAYLQNTMGISPSVSISGNGQSTHDGAIGALNTLAAANNGSIPPVHAVIEPHHSDKPTFDIYAYAPSQQDLTRNPQAFRNVVDTARIVMGLPKSDDFSWNSGNGEGFQGQRKMVQQALQFLSPVQEFTEQNVGARLAERKQLLAAYEKHTNQNGQPDADPATVANLSKSVDFLQKAQDDLTASKAAQQSKMIEAETDAKAAQEVAIRKATLPFDLAKKRAEEAISDGDPKAAGQLLFNGDVAPSQLVSSRKPSFAVAAYAEAKKIAAANGVKWDSQSAEGYFSAAKSPANLAFFGSAKSLTDEGGTLDQLQEAYNKLPNGQFPAFNSIADWTAAAGGSGPVAGFAATVLGVADDAAKVQGGGTGSDTSRDKVLHTFAMSHSPQAMASAINATRRAVDSQMASRIGTNPVMRRMYGDQLLIHVKDKKRHGLRVQDSGAG